MNDVLQTFRANLDHAIRNKSRLVAGGGTFSGEELLAIRAALGEQATPAKTTDRVVIWPNCGPLLLKGVKRNDDGSIKTGWVINGHWNYELRGGECLAKSGNAIVNRWPAPAEIPCIEVPATVRGDYNAVLAWAEAHREPP